MKYHAFFTTQYTQICLEQCCFGASVSNSLANVKNGDIAFLFDGLKRALFGPLDIISEEQYIDKRPIYGTDKRGQIRYKNRVWFKIERAKKTPIVELYSTEKSPRKLSYLLNRYLIATLIANKQVNATPLTQSEGDYLMEQCLNLGKTLQATSTQIPLDVKPVFSQDVLRRPISEATVELLILNKRCHGYLLSFLRFFSAKASYFNQFVFGFQRQCDIVIDAQDRLALIEIKKARNLQDPYDQIIEYLYYCLSSFRLHHNRSTAIESIDLLAIIEYGSKYLNSDAVKAFTKKCSEITGSEHIVIIPHTVNYKVSKGTLETKLYKA